jgi:hypothetical protein
MALLWPTGVAAQTRTAQAERDGGVTGVPYPPPRPFDLMVPNADGVRPTPPRQPEAPPSPADAPSAASPGAAADPAPRAVNGVPLPPARPLTAPLSPAEDEEEEPEDVWPRRTPGQRNLDFEPRVPSPDEVIANGITTDPGTSVACLPAQLKRVLDYVVKRYGAVRVTSTYRPAWRARRNSFHRSCQAVDFRVPGQSPRDVLAFIKTLPETGGHKVYWNGLIHVDTGGWRTW